MSRVTDYRKMQKVQNFSLVFFTLSQLIGVIYFLKHFLKVFFLTLTIAKESQLISNPTKFKSFDSFKSYLGFI